MPIQYIQEYTDREITKATLDLMFKFAERDATDWRFIKLVDGIVQKCDGRDAMCQARTIYDFVKRYVKYVYDVTGVEMVQSPWRTLQRRAGDCDDFATLIYAMLMTRGIPVRFQLWRRSAGKAFSHVNVGALIDKKWRTIDATLKGNGFDVTLPAIMSPVYSKTIVHALKGILVSGFGDIVFTETGMATGTSADKMAQHTPIYEKDYPPAVTPHPELDEKVNTGTKGATIVSGMTVLPGKDIDMSNQVGRRPPKVGTVPISNMPSNIIYVEQSPALTEFVSDTDPIPSVVNENVDTEEGLDRPLYDDIAMNEDEEIEVAPPFGLKELLLAGG